MLNTDSKVPVKTDEQSVTQQPSCEVLKMHQEMLSKALRHYWSNLKNSIKARRYIKIRGLEASSIERFGLGYADSASQGLRSVFPNYHVPALVACGLVKENGMEMDPSTLIRRKRLCLTRVQPCLASRKRRQVLDSQAR